MKRIFIVMMIGFIGLFANAQEHKFGKTTVAELEEKFSPIDSTADAAILYKCEVVKFIVGSDNYWKTITETEVKIKIYKKGGYKYADFSKSYYVGPNPDEVIFLDANTYNLVNGAVVQSKLGKDGQFTVAENKYVNTKKIALPNVTQGSIVEYRYTTTSYNYSSLDTYYFEEEIPVEWSRYVVKIPIIFGYNVTAGGSLMPEIKSELGKSKFAESEKWTLFTLAKIKPIKAETYLNNLNNYKTLINLELSKYVNNNGDVEKYADNWPSVAKKIYKDDSFGKQVQKSDYFKKDIDVLLNGIASPEEKAALIFNFVQTRMNWTHYGSYRAIEGVEKAYADKIGNVAEINLMLTAMFRYAKLDADPVLVSTRDNGIAVFPSRNGFNYVVAAINTEKGIVLYDATSKNAQPNILPTRAINWTGRLVTKKGTADEINMMPKMISKKFTSFTAKLDKNGFLIGNVKNQYTDYLAFVFREVKAILSKDAYLEVLEKEIGNVEVSDYSNSNLHDLQKPVTEDYNLSSSSVTDFINGKMYFNLLLVFATNENPFTDSQRKFPIDFIYPFQQRIVVNLEIPDGYIVESLPQSKIFSIPDNVAKFSYNILAKDNQIQLSVLYEMTKAIIPADEYETLKVFYKEMITKENEKIILKKA